MERVSFHEIVKAVNGEIIINNKCDKYNYVSTDTRKICENSIFVALKGENFNGNDYVIQASEKGANLCIIDEIKFNAEDVKENTSVILVKDTRKALLNLAEYYRSKLKVKIVAITGSTGKTSTKDLVAAALSSNLKVFKTKGNFNNEIGMPLMMLEIDNTYDVAVLEMGMSSLGEIHRLAKVAKPDIALITNIGISHIENLKTRENILKAKMEITDFFTEKCTLIINSENDLLSTLKEDKYNLTKIGFNDFADYKGESIELTEKDISFSLVHKKEKENFNIEVLGKHNVLNSLLAIATARTLGISYKEIKNGMNNLSVTSMRLDIVKCKGYTIIDDCYNASPDSMKAALDVMQSVSGKRKIAVFGTMKELGSEGYKSHKEVGRYASKMGIEELLVLGEYSAAYKEGFNNDNKFKKFNTTKEASQYLKANLQNEDIILIKASRSMKFEDIVKELK